MPQSKFDALGKKDLGKLKILISNDDGINAPGLGILEQIAHEISDDVYVVAPEMEQSGASHSLTMHNPLRVRQITGRRFAVNGTPTDCVLLAQKIIAGDREGFDLVLSGVNHGSNLAEDVTYSGTIAAAMEGTLLEIPSIAFSMCIADNENIRWQTALKHGPEVIRKLIAAGWPEGTLMNVNFPDIEPGEVRGVKVVPHGSRKIGDKIVGGVDPKGRQFYWVGALRHEQHQFPGTDVETTSDGFISITPLSLDLTDYKTLEAIKGSIN